MSKPHLHIDQLRHDVNAKTTIIMTNKGVPTTVSGFSMSEFNMSGNSSYSNPFENSAQQALSDKINQGAAAINSFFGTSISQFQFKDIRQTISMWSASGKPSFTVSLLFIQTREFEPTHGSSVLEPIKKLNAGVYPIVEGTLRISAPLGYTVKGDDVSNVSTLSIGRWFFARNLIMTGVTPTFSQEVVKNGAPLYAQVQVTFEPYRAVDINEVNKWFLI